MTDKNADLRVRLDELDAKIKAQKAKLELHGLFAHEHQITERELRARWAELQAQLQAQTQDEKTLYGKVDWLQKEILKWVAATDLNYEA